MSRNLLMIPMALALLMASGAAFYFYREANRSESEPRTAIILLPDEVPTVATVQNPEKLKDQPFFAQAKAGDKVLVYSIAKKVYLYDPVNNIIVNVAPLSIETTAPATP